MCEIHSHRQFLIEINIKIDTIAKVTPRSHISSSLNISRKDNFFSAKNLDFIKLRFKLRI